MFVNDYNEPTKNVTIEPRKGRVSMFTSGAENPHFVERVHNIIQGYTYIFYHSITIIILGL